jgi:hypothetical protein
MSLLPEEMPGDGARRSWQDVPQELVGKPTTLEELERRFPADKTFSAVRILRDLKNYTIYGRRSEEGYRQRLAYLCKHCNQISFGPPRITDDTSIDLGIPLAGRKGYDMYCVQCHESIDEATFEMS